MAQNPPLAGGTNRGDTACWPQFPPGTWHPTAALTSAATTLVAPEGAPAAGQGVLAQVVPLALADGATSPPAPAGGAASPPASSTQPPPAPSPLQIAPTAVSLFLAGEPVWPAGVPFTMDSVLAIRRDHGSLQRLLQVHPRKWLNWVIKWVRYLLTTEDGIAVHAGVDLTSAPAFKVPTWVPTGNRNGWWDHENAIYFHWTHFLASLEDEQLQRMLGDFGVGACHILELPGIRDNLLPEFKFACKWEAFFTRCGADGVLRLDATDDSAVTTVHARANGKVDVDYASIRCRVERELYKVNKGIVAGLAASYPDSHSKLKATEKHKPQPKLDTTTHLAGGWQRHEYSSMREEQFPYNNPAQVLHSDPQSVAASAAGPAAHGWEDIAAAAKAAGPLAGGAAAPAAAGVASIAAGAAALAAGGVASGAASAASGAAAPAAGGVASSAAALAAGGAASGAAAEALDELE